MVGRAEDPTNGRVGRADPNGRVGRSGHESGRADFKASERAGRNGRVGRPDPDRRVVGAGHSFFAKVEKKYLARARFLGIQ